MNDKMTNITVICNKPHIFESGVCLACERDKAEEEIDNFVEARKLMVDFKFQPNDYVFVTLFNLKYMGRVDSCIYEVVGVLYDVRYADDSGELKFGKFSADELQISKEKTEVKSD